MSPGTSQVVRLVVAAAIVLGGGFALVRSLDDDNDTAAAPPAGSSASADHDHGSHDHGAAAPDVFGDGRLVSAAGYTLRLAPVSDGLLAFRIVDDAGKAQTDFALNHTKPLHLFLFAADLTEFRHVHPVLDDAGGWSLDLPSMSPGRHKVVAEFDVEGDDVGPVMLGGWVSDGGETGDQPLPRPVESVEVDGYTVTARGSLLVNAPSRLEVAITDSAGGPVALQPYLGSWAHAALVHGHTLAVTHLHPREAYAEEAPAPEALHFRSDPGEVGNYRFIVEFATDTGVHQAEFTVPRFR